MEVDSHNGHSAAGLIRQLEQNPEQFEFFQAVRLIQNSFLAGEPRSRRPLLGEEVRIGDSIIRFRSWQSLTFAASDIRKIRAESENDWLRLFEMTVTFLGLTGPNGALPAHYTSLVIERSHTRNKDYSLREFLDLLNHRSISLFYRAWQKYRLPFVYERHQLSGRQEDPITSALYAIVGYSGQPLRDRSTFRDELLLFFGGLFANRTRNASSLQQMISFSFGVLARVEQNVPRWIYLTAENQSSLPTRRHPRGANLALGESTIVGSRIRDVQSLFRVCLGPLSWHRFREFFPGTTQMDSLVQLIHAYAGIELDFEIRISLRADEVPPGILSREGKNPMALGQTTWLGKLDPDRVLDDVAFRFGYGGRPIPS